MDLWIRSQDKMELFSAKDIWIPNDADTSIWGQDGLRKTALANYKTKERALEVLDEIQSLLISCSSYEKSKLCLKNGYDDLYIPYEINTKVYQMPEE